MKALPQSFHQRFSKFYAEHYGGVCAICGETESLKLNYEAMIHHGADQVECIDRKECQRRKRKRT